MASKPPPDPRLVEIVERTLAPLRAFTPPEMLAVMREEMMDGMANDPYPAGLLRKLRPVPVVHESGDPAENHDAADAGWDRWRRGAG
jgi:hypothetical protein